MTQPLHAILAAAALSLLPSTLLPLTLTGDPPSLPQQPQPDPKTPPSRPQPPPPVILTQPLPVRFRLADGVRVTGQLTQWDRDGIDGSFGPRMWTELQYEDLWRLARRLIDRDSPAHWIDLGRALLLTAIDQPNAERRAEQAFRLALSLDPDAEAAILAVRDEAAAARERRRQIAAAARAHLLVTRAPESVDWPPDPWPPLDPQQRRDALQTVRADAANALQRAGLLLQPVETDFFLCYSDAPRDDLAKWALQLDRLYALLANRFNIPPADNIFWGKTVVFVFTQRDRFVLVEAEAFNQLVPRFVTGLCHPVGPKVFINLHRHHDDDRFNDALTRAAVHAFLHRYRSPRRLPPWANEGIAAYYASVMHLNSFIDSARRDQALRYIRNAGDINAVLAYKYPDDAFPPPDAPARAVGSLLVELMIREQPDRFLAFVNAVKEGKNWPQALKDDFAASPSQLIRTFTHYHRVND